MCFSPSFPVDRLCQEGRYWWEGDENGQLLAHGACLQPLWSFNQGRSEFKTVHLVYSLLFFFPLQEKDLVPKLFKVLAPRFEKHSNSYTRKVQIPKKGNLDRAKMAVLEYKGNPFPPLYPAKKRNELTLINQLLQGYREERAEELANAKEKDQELANPN